MDDRVTMPDLEPENPDAAGPVRPYAFLLQPSAIQSASSFARYALEHFSVGRYATLFDPVNPVSLLQARAFENVVRKSGKVVAASVPLPEGDPGAAVRALRDATVEAVYICAAIGEERRGGKGRPRGPARGGPAGKPGVVLRRSPRGPGQRPTTPGSAWQCPPTTPGLPTSPLPIFERFGEKPRPGVVPGWDAAGLIIAAVRKAGTSAPPKVRDAIEQTTAFKALQGPLDMDRKTHRPAALPVAIMRIVRGQYLTAEARCLYKPGGARAP